MSEKTEQPTAKKLREAREKGQVAHSKEVVSTALLASVYALFFANSDYFLSQLLEIITLPSLYYDLPFSDALKKIVEGIIGKSLNILTPIVILVIIVGVVSNVVQVGPLLAFESIKMDIKKINPAEGAKKIFAMKNLVELIKSIFKIGFLSSLVYWVIHSNLYDIIKLPYCGSSCLPSLVGHLMAQIAIVSVIAFLIVAVADFVFQKHDHIKKLKMTIDEVKREYKDSEGNPEIKSQRKQIHREMLEGGMIDDVKRSSVIVTNPTHFAIGIQYDGDTRTLPIVCVKSTNQLAQRVKKIAAEAGIPMIENVPLARALYAQAELDNYIPSEFIEPVADVLKWVAQLDDK
ncbi:EscU/YscU/HrcU family type III secretion system export apparatus switch protein [Gammaproteobacteria bacterium 45_16_T64]|nr:EscU/YscU/HrcU family type III secretion system export apparatus switch protein [Gammaproteobacteria bacterium 45_16_T64]